MAEEFAFQQARRNGRTVQLHEGPAAPSAQIVNGAGQQLLAGPGLAEDEHRRVRRRHELDLLQHLLQRGAVSDDLFEVVLGPDLVFEVELFFRQLVLERSHLLVHERIVDRDGDLAGGLAEQCDILRRERLVAKPRYVQRGELPLARHQRETAGGLEPFGGSELAKIRLASARFTGRDHKGPTGAERLAGWRIKGRAQALGDEPLPGREIQRVHDEPVPLRLVEGKTGVVVGNDFAEARRDGSKQVLQVQAGHDRVIDLERQSEMVQLAGQLPLRGLRAFVVQHVVHGDGHLLGDLLEKSISSSPNAHGVRLLNPIAPSRRKAVVSGTMTNDATPI
jgi:hypothetical protein